MGTYLDFVYRFVSKSWDTWTLVSLVISMVLLPYILFPFSKGGLILVIILLVVGHINKNNFGVRLGFMAAALLIGIISRIM